MKSLIFAIAFTAAAVSAAPSPPAGSCKSGVLKIIEDVLHLLPQGTPFCSTYLGIAPVTSTISTTVAATTSYTSTSTSTVTISAATVSTLIVPYVTTTTTGTYTTTSVLTTTAAATDIVTSFSVSQIVSTSTAATPTTTTVVTTTLSETYYSLYPPPAKKARRDLDERGIAIPSELISYAKSEISSACSCLNLPTPTTTKDASVTNTILAISTTTTTVTSTNSVVVTSTQTVISAVGASTTVGTISIVTDTVTATTESVSSTVSITTVTPQSSTVTSTITVTSVATVTTDPCDPTTGVVYYDEVYNFAGILHSGHTEMEITTGDLSSAGCCRACFNTPGCVIAFSVVNDYCVLELNNISPVVGADAQCPNGYDVIDSFYDSSVGLPNPNEPIDSQLGFTIGPCFAGSLS